MNAVPKKRRLRTEYLSCKNTTTATTTFMGDHHLSARPAAACHYYDFLFCFALKSKWFVCVCVCLCLCLCLSETEYLCVMRISLSTLSTLSLSLCVCVCLCLVHPPCVSDLSTMMMVRCESAL